MEKMSPEELKRNMDVWRTWLDDLRKKGHFEAGEPLNSEGSVLSGKNGGTVTDGPYAEGKEEVGGFVLVTARDFAHATERAQGCPIFQNNGTVRSANGASDVPGLSREHFAERDELRSRSCGGQSFPSRGGKDGRHSRSHPRLRPTGFGGGFDPGSIAPRRPAMAFRWHSPTSGGVAPAGRSQSRTRSRAAEANFRRKEKVTALFLEQRGRD